VVAECDRAWVATDLREPRPLEEYAISRCGVRLRNSTSAALWVGIGAPPLAVCLGFACNGDDECVGAS